MKSRFAPPVIVSFPGPPTKCPAVAALERVVTSASVELIEAESAHRQLIRTSASGYVEPRALRNHSDIVPICKLDANIIPRTTRDVMVIDLLAAGPRMDESACIRESDDTGRDRDLQVVCFTRGGDVVRNAEGTHEGAVIS